MIITKSREYTVNMGNYESLKVGGSVTLDTAEFPQTNPTAEEAAEWAEEKLTELLAEDLNEAKVLTNTKDSYVLSWKVK